MKESSYKSYDELPLFLNAATVAKVLGVSPSSGYELMHEPDFPVLKIGNRLVVPKEKFVEWVSQYIEGGADGSTSSGPSVIQSRTTSSCPTRYSCSAYRLVPWRSTRICSAVKTESHTSAGPATKLSAER